MDRFVSTTDPLFPDAQKVQWSFPPIDGVGYIPSYRLLRLGDAELRQVIEKLENQRYDVSGWRNVDNRWRRLLGLDDTEGKRVLDYGCGCGVEALQFARRGNTVHVADIAENNVRLAVRVAEVHGLVVQPVYLEDRPPFFSLETRDPIDIFYCCGVLHHIPGARDVLLRVAEVLADDGEIRLMVYSDKAWLKSVGTPLPPVTEDVESNEKFQTFVGTFDSVGGYADWYSAEKLRYRFGDFLDLVRFDYICSDHVYAVAILKKKIGGLA